MSSWRCFPFVDSAPRAYRLKASNAAPSSSTSTGTFRIRLRSRHNAHCARPPSERPRGTSDPTASAKAFILAVAHLHLAGCYVPPFTELAQPARAEQASLLAGSNEALGGGFFRADAR